MSASDHYHDWDRDDGWWCTCGREFSYPGFVRHIEQERPAGSLSDNPNPNP